MKNWDKKIKKMDCWDMKLVKLSTVAFVLLILNIWPAAMGWVASVHWGWFLAATIIFAWRPLMRVWK